MVVLPWGTFPWGNSVGVVTFTVWQLGRGCDLLLWGNSTDLPHKPTDLPHELPHSKSHHPSRVAPQYKVAPLPSCPTGKCPMVKEQEQDGRRTRGRVCSFSPLFPRTRSGSVEHRNREAPRSRPRWGTG